MSRSGTKSVVSTAVGLLAGVGLLWVGWGAYARSSTERVPYETVLSLDGAEIRRYPETVVATTTADDENEAFGRLFRYIEGENSVNEEVSMTAPVVTANESIAMTAPVATEAVGEQLRMSFFLPEEYSAADAPVPDDPDVSLERVPPRTLAVRSFSWYATDDRVERNRRALLDALEDGGVTTTGDPVLLRYDDPWTPPFMRTNEIAVEVT
jgi:hypothetical protein